MGNRCPADGGRAGTVSPTSLADDEEEGEGEGNVIFEEKKNLDDVNKKTH